MKRLMRAGAGVLAVRMVSAGASFGLMLILSRLLGVDGLGAFALVVAVVTVLAALSRLGLDTAVVRFVAPSYFAGDAEGARAVGRLATRPVLVAGALWTVLALGTGVATWWIPAAPEWVGALPWAAAGVMPWALAFVYAGLLFGSGASTQGTLLQGLIPVCVTLIAVGLWWAYARALEPKTALAAWAVGHVVAAGIGWGLWRRRLARAPEPTEAAPPDVDPAVVGPALLEAGRPLMWTTLLHMADSWAMPLIIGTLGGAVAAGLYAAAVRYAYVMGYVALAVSAVVMPEFSRAFAANELQRVRELGASSARLIALASAVPLAVFVIWSGPLMGLYGDGFEQGAVVLTVLALGQFGVGLFGLVGAALAMGGAETSLRTATAISVVTGIITAAVLTPSLGVLGGGVGTAVAWVGAAAIGSVLLRRRLGVSVHLLAARPSSPSDV